MLIAGSTKANMKTKMVAMLIFPYNAYTRRVEKTRKAGVSQEMEIAREEHVLEIPKELSRLKVAPSFENALHLSVWLESVVLLR